MKTRDEVFSRLRKLRTRYVTRYISQTRDRKPCNCRYNHVHEPLDLRHTKSQSKPAPIAPRDQVTLVVIQEDRPVGLCMYGADDASKWPGNICDDVATAKACPMFVPRATVEEAKTEFIDRLEDDEFVFNNYRDVATLQWVLGERVHDMPLSWWERLIVWFHMRFAKVLPASPRAPEPDATSLWAEDDTAPPAGS